MQRQSIVRMVAAVAAISLIAWSLRERLTARTSRPHRRRFLPRPGTQPSQVIGTGSISGTVVALATGEPIAEAQVRLFSQQLAGNSSTMPTDAQGRFAFSELPAGRYSVHADREGFVRVSYGQRRPVEAHSPSRSQTASSRTIDLRLPRHSVIAGRVLDSRGNPLAGAFVRAMYSTMNMGYRRMQSASSARTDQAGNYRIQWLQASEYVVCASTTSPGPLMSEAQRLRAEIDRLKNLPFRPGPDGKDAEQKNAAQIAEMEARLPAQLGPVFGYAPACNPKDGAPAIALAPGEERHGVDFQLPDTKLARIEGMVRGLPDASRDGSDHARPCRRRAE